MHKNAFSQGIKTRIKSLYRLFAFVRLNSYMNRPNSSCYRTNIVQHRRIVVKNKRIVCKNKSQADLSIIGDILLSYLLYEGKIKM